MKTIMARSPHEGSFSFSRRFLNWRIIKKVDEDDNDLEVLTTIKDTSYHSFSGAITTNNLPLTEEENENFYHSSSFSYSSQPPSSICIPNKTTKKKKHTSSSSKLKSALSLFSNKTHSPNSSKLITRPPPSLGSKVVGTLFGYRRGQVHIAFQNTPNSPPSFLIQISTPTSFLVREMASGLVRVALECDKKPPKLKLLDEQLWRAYCNGKKCGYATRKECAGVDDEDEVARILRSVGPVTMGAGVLPGGGNEVGPEGELMYMRARFERVVGSKDSEAFYMMNPDGNGGPELSVYLLRV